MSYITRKTCRLCGSGKLTSILSLGNLYVSTFVKSKKDRTIKAPLELVLCGQCTLLQLKHTAPQELLYSRYYWYYSRINPVISKDLKEITKVAQTLVPIKKGDIVLDIGANDGTLLSYYPKYVIKVGCEPAKNLTKALKKITPDVIDDFWNYNIWQKKYGDKKAKVITAIGMFYDMEDPNQFIRDSVKALDEKGVFIAQLMCLGPMLEKNDLGNICVKPNTLILGDNKTIREVKKSNYAIGGNGELNEVLNTMKRNYHGAMVHIKPMYLEPVITTPEHPIKIIRKESLRYTCGQLKSNFRSLQQKYEFEWVPAKDVKRNDWVVMPRLIHNNHIRNLDLRQFNNMQGRGYRGGLLSFPLNEETAWLLGLYVAEGHIGGKKNNPYINFTLHKKETSIVERLSTIFKSLGYKTHAVHYQNRNSIEVRIVCAALARALHEWVGKKAVEKYIPDFILFASKIVKASFLKGLFEGDGYIKKNKVHFHTSSKKLAFHTQLLTASLGGMLGISYVKPYQRIIRGGIVNSGDSWQLRGSSKELAKIFSYEHRGPVMDHAIISNDHILVPIKKVGREEYSGTVHNIETRDNTYLVSNAVVHNCHEHLEYYSFESLKFLFEANGLEIFKVEENSINGGSYRIFARHYKKGSIPFQEKFTKKDYKDFFTRIKKNKDACVEFIKQEVKKGKLIYGYGASTKGNTILQYYGLDNKMIEGIADKSPEKWGKYTVGTYIPIVDEKEARKKADYFLVLPWAFFETFYKRETEWLERGGKFIVPLPQCKVVGLNDKKSK